LTARVHPGESPASFVLNGIINFILNEISEQARMIREKFVFKIIPILNPDGVYRGYYRHDTKN
jgi:murein tripeptide amidase MpaA